MIKGTGKLLEDILPKQFGPNVMVKSSFIKEITNSWADFWNENVAWNVVIVQVNVLR